MSTRSISNTFTLLLSSLGILIAGVLTIEHYKPDFNLPCGSVGGGCRGVVQGPYGALGPIPTSVFGLLMYALIVVLCVQRRKRLQALRRAETASANAYSVSGSSSTEQEAGEEGSLSAESTSTPPVVTPSVESAVALQQRAEVKQLDFLVWLLALMGAGISWWLQYTAFFVLASFCPWCFASAITITFILAFASRDYLLGSRKLNGEQKMLIAVGLFILPFVAALNFPAFMVQYLKVFNPRVFDVPYWKKQIVAPDSMHIKGKANAPFTIVEFADFQCPSCKQAREEMEKILQQWPDKIKLGFRNFPLEMHANAGQAAIAAEAADAQGKFWEMHKYLYDHQDDLESPTFDPERFLQYAAAIGLNVQQFKQDMESRTYRARVEKDTQDGRTCQVNMTPTFFFVSSRLIKQVEGARELTNLLNNQESAIWK